MVKFERGIKTGQCLATCAICARHWNGLDTLYVQLCSHVRVFSLEKQWELHIQGDNQGCYQKLEWEEATNKAIRDPEARCKEIKENRVTNQALKISPQWNVERSMAFFIFLSLSLSQYYNYLGYSASQRSLMSPGEVDSHSF